MTVHSTNALVQTPLPLLVDAAIAPDRLAAARLDGATAGYDLGPDILVGVSLDLKPGATAIVTGAAGAGKSTLLHLMRAAIAPREGRVALLGADVARLSPVARAGLRRRIGYAAQAPHFVEAETLFDNVALPLNLDPASRQTGQDVMDLLGFLGLSREAGKPAALLSHGQRKLAALARALVARPDLVLADDPMAGIGAEAETKVVRLLGELSRHGAAVVVTAPAAPEELPGGIWRIRDKRLEPAPESALKPLDPTR
jgi:cell division transport system ATP-binding protein